jgi:DNA sulfur modification protein DndB
MSLTFCYTFPAVMGNQAGRDYFVIMCPLNVLPKLFIFNDEYLSPEVRSQRTLNKQRIPEMSDYILKNRHDYVFSSLTASIDGNYEFRPFDNQQFNAIGLLKIDMDSKLLINDGQHRKHALEEALKADSSLQNETISIVLFVDEDLKRSQQIFSDLNKHAINVSKSISITFDHRDPISTLTKELIFKKPELYEYTDLERSTLPKFSNKLFTISNFYKANERIISGHSYRDPVTKQKLDTFIFNYWYYLVNHINEWQLVFSQSMTPYTLREEYIIPYGTVLEAFGIIGNYLYSNNIFDFEKTFEKLNTINWKRNNLSDWKDRVIGQSGRILRNTKCIYLTCIKIKILLGLALTPQEMVIEQAYLEEHNE